MRDRPTAAAAAALTLVTLLHLGAHLAGAAQVAEVSQWFLMPLLALAVAAATRGRPRSRLVRLVLVALVFSWLGDTAPDVVPDDLSFVTMLGFFAVAQVCYVVAFRPLRADGVLGRRPVLVVPYALALAGLLVACAPGAGDLLVPAVVYGLLLTTMAVLATFDRIAALGGALFLLSDGLIAMNAFADWYSLPLQGFWVMLTYVAGQVLLAVGVLRRDRADAAARAPSSAAVPA